MKKILDGMMSTMNAVKPPRMTALRELHEAETGGPFSILIGTILSARTKDENTAKVVRALFARYRDARELAGAKIRDVERIIRPIGFYRVKARRIIEVAKIVDSEYGGVVPEDIDKLVGMPGVGRKTANCVLVYAFEKPAIPVDIHVHRISNRLGLVETKTPEETEQALMKLVPRRHWLRINDTFVMYGQNICKPVSPMCGVCQIRAECLFYRNNVHAADPPPAKPAGRRRSGGRAPAAAGSQPVPPPQERVTCDRDAPAAALLPLYSHISKGV